MLLSDPEMLLADPGPPGSPSLPARPSQRPPCSLPLRISTACTRSIAPLQSAHLMAPEAQVLDWGALPLGSRQAGLSPEGGR